MQYLSQKREAPSSIPRTHRVWWHKSVITCWGSRVGRPLQLWPASLASSKSPTTRRGSKTRVDAPQADLSSRLTHTQSGPAQSSSRPRPFAHACLQRDHLASALPAFAPSLPHTVLGLRALLRKSSPAELQRAKAPCSLGPVHADNRLTLACRAGGTQKVANGHPSCSACLDSPHQSEHTSAHTCDIYTAS